MIPSCLFTESTNICPELRWHSWRSETSGVLPCLTVKSEALESKTEFLITLKIHVGLTQITVSRLIPRQSLHHCAQVYGWDQAHDQEETENDDEKAGKLEIHFKELRESTFAYAFIACKLQSVLYHWPLLVYCFFDTGSFKNHGETRHKAQKPTQS